MVYGIWSMRDILFVWPRKTVLYLYYESRYFFLPNFREFLLLTGGRSMSIVIELNWVYFIVIVDPRCVASDKAKIDRERETAEYICATANCINLAHGQLRRDWGVVCGSRFSLLTTANLFLSLLLYSPLHCSIAIVSGRFLGPEGWDAIMASSSMVRAKVFREAPSGSRLKPTALSDSTENAFETPFQMDLFRHGIHGTLSTAKSVAETQRYINHILLYIHLSLGT